MTRRRPTLLAGALATTLVPLGLAVGPSPVLAADRAEPSASENGAPGFGADRLRRVAPEGLRIGTAAAGGGHHESMPYSDPFSTDSRYRTFLKQEFNSLSPENQMKWDYIHPERDRYNFAAADAIVEFAEKHGQVVRGHTLLWHSQNPSWLTNGDFTDEELRTILQDHIQTVVGRYAGRIQQWDVANEIFTDTWEGGDIRLRPQNIWIRRLGPGIIADAFRWAHAADPQAKLFLNDYAVEHIGPKSDAYYELSKQLLADGVPLHGFAFQAHLSMQYGYPGNLQQNMQRFDDLGLETAITELDVRMVLGADGKPSEAQLAKQADWYQRTLQACLAVEDCGSFTLWGFTDKYSWVPVFFENEGAATVMFEDYRRKPAYYALQDTLAQAD